jgi:hypothetical protein
VVPGNGPVVIIVNPHIKQHIKDEGEVEKGEIKTIYFFTYLVLNSHLNTKEPDWFDQQVQKDQQSQVCDEVFFQTRRLKIFFKSIQM